MTMINKNYLKTDAGLDIIINDGGRFEVIILDHENIVSLSENDVDNLMYLLMKFKNRGAN